MRGDGGCGTQDAGPTNSVSPNWVRLFIGISWNSEHAIRTTRRRSIPCGALCAETGHHTGRSPKDKHTVVDALTGNTVGWDGNRKMTQAQFVLLYNDFLAHAESKTLFAQDLYGGADPKYRIKTRVYTELAWHSLFIRQSRIRPERAELTELRAGADHHRHAVVPARRQASRRSRGFRHGRSSPSISPERSC